jgi:hypothetical protein
MMPADRMSCGAVLIGDAEELLRVKEEGQLRAQQFEALDAQVAEEAVRGVKLGESRLLLTCHTSFVLLIPQNSQNLDEVLLAGMVTFCVPQAGLLQSCALAVW